MSLHDLLYYLYYNYFYSTRLGLGPVLPVLVLVELMTRLVLLIHYLLLFFIYNTIFLLILRYYAIDSILLSINVGSISTTDITFNNNLMMMMMMMMDDG